MDTFNAILRGLKDIPANRLEELYQIVHSLNPNKTKKAAALRKKILSFAGAFGDMSEKDYADFLKHTTNTRTKLFDRSVDV